MGWMGWSVNFFFFAHILKTTIYFFLIVSVPSNICFCTSFGIFAEKNRNILFFKIFRQNHRLLFFRKIFQGFLNFSKNTRYIFLIVFGPLRRVKKTSFEKKIKKKIEYYFCQKISQVFFSMTFGRFLKGFLL